MCSVPILQRRKLRLGEGVCLSADVMKGDGTGLEVLGLILFLTWNMNGSVQFKQPTFIEGIRKRGRERDTSATDACE